MASILIDGYNVLGKAADKDRDRLIQAVVDYHKTTRYDVILFFDGTHTGTPYGDDFIHGGVRIKYSPLGETADDHIIMWMQEHPHDQYVVVSSDRKIQKGADRHQSTFVEAIDFLKRLKQKNTKQSMSESQDAPWQEGRDVVYKKPKRGTRKKGNPRKKSKKEKKRHQTLKKI
jgi:predicted RNA-binding protein with PIN domain